MRKKSTLFGRVREKKRHPFFPTERCGGESFFLREGDETLSSPVIFLFPRPRIISEHDAKKIRASNIGQARRMIMMRDDGGAKHRSEEGSLGLICSFSGLRKCMHVLICVFKFRLDRTAVRRCQQNYRGYGEDDCIRSPLLVLQGDTGSLGEREARR